MNLVNGTTMVVVKCCWLNWLCNYTVVLSYASDRKNVQAKGQLISKCLFGIVNFFQNTNENKSHSSKVEFIRSFFWRNASLKKSFRLCLTFSDSLNWFELAWQYIEMTRNNLCIISIPLTRSWKVTVVLRTLHTWINFMNFPRID